jgi:hypothetical protein
MTDQQLQSLRNMGCEFEEAADEIERLRAALAESCDEHRSEVYDTTAGGGCVLLRDAVAAEREACARSAETLTIWPGETAAEFSKRLAACLRGA